MNHTAHKNFAVNVLKAVSASTYDKINGLHEERNAAIRAARKEYDDALTNNLATIKEKASALAKLFDDK